MKKLLISVLVVSLVLTISGCGSNGVDPNQVITKDKNETEQVKEPTLYVELGEKKVVVGEEFDAKEYPEYTSKYEIPSCAFQGTDNVYNYDDIEITAYSDGDKEIVYSIYFIEPSAKTEKGITLGDSLNDVVTAYGSDCESSDTAYFYKDGNTKLTFIFENEIVIAIEYILMVD